MKKKLLPRILIIVLALMIASLACASFSGEEATKEAPAQSQPTKAEAQPTAAQPEPTEVETQPTEAAPDAPESFDTQFPLPPDVQNFMKLEVGHINFQTSMSLDEVIEFYRKEFTARGLTERGLLTVITDDAFSMVYDGAPNGLATVIQGVKLDAGTTNVNVRFEDT